MTLRQWIKDREINGRFFFSVDDVRRIYLIDGANSYSKSDSVIQTELARLTAQGIIQPVYKGFYTIVPVQYQARGVIPPAYYIDQLMTYLCRPYYISLLSAAELLGAAHQKPQRVSVTTVLPNLHTSKQKNERIVWNYRSKIREDLLLKKNSETGQIVYSSAELTAVDLVQYAHLVGGLSNVSTVLDELVEVLDFQRNFDALCEVANIAAIQRLGYIFEQILGYEDIANVLYNLLLSRSKKLNYILLSPKKKNRQLALRDTRWKIIINQEIEPDEL